MSNVIPIRAQKQLVPGRDRYADIAGYAYCIQDTDGDTKVCAGTDGDNTIRVDLGGATPITNALTINQTNGFWWNTNNDDLDFRIDGQTYDNVIFVDTSIDSVGFNTNQASWNRGGSTIRSAFLSRKQDIANANTGGNIVFSTSAFRAADYSFLKARGTEDAPTVLQSTDVISNMRWEGYDGASFRIGLTLRAQVDPLDAVPTTADVRMQWRFLTWNGVDLAAAMTIRASRKVGIGTVDPDHILHVVGQTKTEGGRIRKTRTVTTADSPVSVLETDHEILCDTSSGAITLTLPAGVTGTNHRLINGGSAGNNVTVNPDGAETIRGASSATLSDGDILIITNQADNNWW